MNNTTFSKGPLLRASHGAVVGLSNLRQRAGGSWAEAVEETAYEEEPLA